MVSITVQSPDYATKKMNKSKVESGGSDLSTNLSLVVRKRTSRKLSLNPLKPVKSVKLKNPSQERRNQSTVVANYDYA